MDLPKALGLESHGAEENTVSFELYAACQDAPSAELAALRVRLLNHILPFVRGYIWQRDRFFLQLSVEQQAPWHRKRTAATSRRQPGRPESATAAQVPPHLWGAVNFGDNVEDEWFIVWLLLELTHAFPITARVWDNDGEFLLIEAAYGLPRWVKPETAMNRVWLHGGTFHLVPLPRRAGDPLLAATPSLGQALAAVRGAAVDTAAPHGMQSALQQRLAGFPGRAAESMHVAHALVPARVAQLLRGEPQLLAAAVEAFHYRDPDDVKAASRMAALPARDMVLAAPTFSRCLYAQLALQEFAPPRGYPMPMPSDPLYGPAEVGLKLTAGFEMMLANRARFGQQQEGAGDATGAAGGRKGSSGRQDPSSMEEGDEEAELANDASWQAFRAHLKASAYFQGSLPGSMQHTQLLRAAVQQYRQSEQYLTETLALTAPATCADALLQQAVDPASFPLAEQLPPQGSEGWMQEQAGQQLEAELAQRQREMEQSTQQRQRRQAAEKGTAAAVAAAAGGQPNASGGQEEEFDPSELAGQLRAFVEKMSGLEGAEVPAAAGAPAGSGIALDEVAFAAELQKVLGLTQAAMRHAGRSGGGGGDEDGGSSVSSEEGSSFFSGSDDEGDASSLSDVSDEDQQQQPGLHTHRQQAAQPPASAAAQTAASVRTGRGGAAAAPAAAAFAAAEAREAEDEEQQGWEADTATDSDDDARFMQAYALAMDQQLAATRMADSFELAPAAASAAGGTSAAGGGGRHARQAAAGGQAAEAGREEEGGEEGGGQEEAAAALRPVDLDVNLVKSLLASYGEQQGLPGPAGTLAGLMGMRLPHPQSQQ